MTSEIVSSYQWVLRSLLEPDAVLLLKRVDLFSFLVYIWSVTKGHLLLDRPPLSVVGFLSVIGWTSSEQRWKQGNPAMMSSLGMPVLKWTAI